MSRPVTPLHVLYAIERRDPDGDETRTAPPTEQDYAAFECWAAAEYGEPALTDYRKGGWAPIEEE